MNSCIVYWNRSEYSSPQVYRFKHMYPWVALKILYIKLFYDQVEFVETEEELKELLR